ncbi:MAG: rhodanese-like domain-containing protein [Gammaproteobacteria bacterium]
MRDSLLVLMPAILTISMFVAFADVASTGDSGVRITSDLEAVEVIHNGKPITITRNQDPDHRINPEYAKTARPCPPFCVQPAVMAPGVETIGELELLQYLKRIADGEDSLLVIDSRTPDWVSNGTIPGSINISWQQLNPESGADPLAIAEILERQFGALTLEGLWDFSAAKTLVLFCNGPWCGQSPTNIRTLLKFGYPAHKIKWYRGGMQDWEALGFTVVK